MHPPSSVPPTVGMLSGAWLVRAGFFLTTIPRRGQRGRRSAPRPGPAGRVGLFLMTPPACIPPAFVDNNPNGGLVDVVCRRELSTVITCADIHGSSSVDKRGSSDVDAGLPARPDSQMKSRPLSRVVAEGIHGLLQGMSTRLGRGHCQGGLNHEMHSSTVISASLTL